MVLLDQIFCDRIFVKIALGIQMVCAECFHAFHAPLGRPFLVSELARFLEMKLN